MADCPRGKGLAEREAKGAHARRALLTPTFNTGNNFKDESAELLCQALSVRSRGWGQPSCGGAVPGDLGTWGGPGPRETRPLSWSRLLLSVWALAMLAKATASGRAVWMALSILSS